MNTIIQRGLRTASFPRTASSLPFKSKILPQHPFKILLSQYRYASTTTTQAVSTPSRKSSINGPPTTMPADLALPTRAPGQAFFPAYALALGKAYVTFYKTGIKNIYKNFVASRPIQHTVDKKYEGSLSRAVSSGFLSRADFQLLVRNWFDVKRVPMFALVLLVCGEFTPLVVVAITGIVPWTCRIPKQVENDRRKLEKRRSISFRNLTAEPPREKGVQSLERMQLLHISWSLGLSSPAWDWLGGELPGLPNAILRRKVARRVHYLELDDKLIKQSGVVRDLDAEEVKLALVERGVDVVGKGEAQLRANLNAWLRSRDKAPIEKLLLTRPNAWPVKP